MHLAKHQVLPRPPSWIKRRDKGDVKGSRMGGGGKGREGKGRDGMGWEWGRNDGWLCPLCEILRTCCYLVE